MPLCPDDQMGDDREPFLAPHCSLNNEDNDSASVYITASNGTAGTDNTEGDAFDSTSATVENGGHTTINVTGKYVTVYNNVTFVLSSEAGGVGLKVRARGQDQTDEEIYQEVTGCFTMLTTWFRSVSHRLRGVHRGCIALELTPNSPADLRKLVGAFRSGEINELIADLVSRQRVFDSVSGSVLNLDIEVTIGESLLEASGLTRDDLQNIRSTIRVTRQEPGDEMCTESEAMDTSQSICSVSQPGDPEAADVVHLIIIGRPRVGKGGLANIITRSKVFVSKFSAFPVTKECQTDRFIHDETVFNISDTPGVNGYDKTKPITTSAEATKIAALVMSSQLGRTFFLLTCRIGEWKEDELTLHNLKILLGPTFTKSTIVVFTGKESLDYEGMTLDDYFSNKPSSSLLQLSADVEGRVIAVSKKGSPEDHNLFITQLLTHVDSLRRRGSGYTWSMMEEAITAEDERRLQAIDEEEERQEREMKAIEEACVQTLQQEMDQQLDLQGASVEDPQPGTGTRRPADPGSSREDSTPVQKKARTELASPN